MIVPQEWQHYVVKEDGEYRLDRDCYELAKQCCLARHAEAPNHYHEVYGGDTLLTATHAQFQLKPMDRVEEVFSNVEGRYWLVHNYNYHHERYDPPVRMYHV